MPDPIEPKASTAWPQRVQAVLNEVVPEQFKGWAPRVLLVVLFGGAVVYGIAQILPLMEQFRKLDETTQAFAASSKSLSDAKTSLEGAIASLEKVHGDAKAAHKTIDDLRNELKRKDAELHKAQADYANLIGSCSPAQFREPYIYRIGQPVEWRPSEDSWIKAMAGPTPSVGMNRGAPVELPCSAPRITMRVEFVSPNNFCRFEFVVERAVATQRDITAIAVGDTGVFSQDGLEYQIKLFAVDSGWGQPCRVMIRRIRPV